MALLSTYESKALLKLIQDEGLDISGMDTATFADKTWDIKRQKNIKAADYMESELLSYAFGFELKDGFRKGLELQSKKPLYALENPGFWGAENQGIDIEIKGIGDERYKLPESIEGTKTYYSRSLNTLTDTSRGSSHLKFMFILTEQNYLNNVESIEDLVEFKKENLEIGYVFETVTKDFGTKLDIIKNKVESTGILKNCYRTFTIFDRSIINWRDVNGKATKFLANPEKVGLGEKVERIDETYVVTIKIGEKKERIAILFNVEPRRSGITANILQKKILAVQKFKPKVEQLKPDNSPEWVAKRLDYNKYGIASEDVTLENGTSYFWDIGKCWKIRDNSTIQDSKGDAREEEWYWEVVPFLKGQSSEDSETGKSGSEGEGKGVWTTNNTDVTAFSNDIESMSVNVTPAKVARRAYAMIIDDPDFKNSDFKTSGQEGIYFQSSNAEFDSYFGMGRLYDNSKSDLEKKRDKKINKEYSKNTFIHPADLLGGCFYNEESQTPTNGLLIEAKEKIFDVYFLTKGSFTEEVVSQQYDILDSLKNGTRKQVLKDENDKDIIVDSPFIGKKWKDWYKGKLMDNEVEAIKTLRKDAIIMEKAEKEAGCIVKLTEDIKKKYKDANERFKDLVVGKDWVYNPDVSKLKFSFTSEKTKKNYTIEIPEERAGTVYYELDEKDDGLICPMKGYRLTKHFCWHDSDEMIKGDNNTLIQGDYLLSFGYNQERITRFTDVWELFKIKFAKFNKLSIPTSILQKYPGEIPWWKQEGEYVILNKLFVDIFFYKSKDRSLKPVDIFDLEGTDDGGKSLKKYSEIYKNIKENGSYDFSLTVTEDEINEMDSIISEILESNEYAEKYIDNVIDYIFDNFYEIICNVYGTVDAEGIRRTKGYFVKGTPFDIKKDKDGKLLSGFDAKELLEPIILRAFTGIYDKDLRNTVFARLENLLTENPNVDLKNENAFKDFNEKIQEAFTEAMKSSQLRYQGDDNDEERARIRKLSEINATNANIVLWMQRISTGIGLLATATIVSYIAVTSIVGMVAASTATTGAIAFLAGSTIALAAVCIVVVVVIAAIATTIWFAIDNYKKDRDKRTMVSDDYVYKFTCRAKRALRQYSITKRGTMVGENSVIVKKTEKGEDEKYDLGDGERRLCYYNWLAEIGHKYPEGSAESMWSISNEVIYGSEKIYDPFDGRVMVILPTTDEVIDDGLSDYDVSALPKIESFIQTWMGKVKSNEVIDQAEIPIQGYYDMLSGMHPYIEASFRMNLGACGKKKTKDGELFLREDGLPLFYKDGDTYYEAVKEKNKDGVEGTDWIKGESLGKLLVDSGEKDKNGKIIWKENDKVKEKMKTNFFTLNSIDYPYFKSLSIVDNGVKSLKMELFDPNFASYTTGLVSTEGKRFSTEGSSNVMSLESLIRGAVRSPTFFQDETIDKYNSGEEAGEISSDYLKIDEALAVSPTNLKIRYGYADEDEMDINNEFFETKEVCRSVGRVGRWWDVKKFGNTGDIYNLSSVKKWVKDGKIQNAAGTVWVDSPTSSGANAKEDPKNRIDAPLDHIKLINSWDQTTSMSREFEYMITGLETELQEDGISYTISAIETKDATVMRTRFLQRYADITANPEEVLYILMHMFNEGNNGENVSSSKVKILLISDEYDMDVPQMRNKLNMNYDLKNIPEEELTGTEADNIYEKALQEGELEIQEDLLKNITISLGGDSATKNYGTSSTPYKPLYKTMAQLLNEFCAACPPKKLIQKRIEVTDENGNDVLSNQKSTSARPLKWFSIEDKINDITYVCLYYRTVMKTPRIRVYTWGPNNPTQSCVKSIKIKNANEFGVLAGIRAFDGQNGKVISRMNGEEGNQMEQETRATASKSNFGKDATVFGSADYVGLDARSYDNAFASCMYEGTMEIMGDPFWSFDGLLQPCTYPIKLNVIIPQSEFTRVVDAGMIGGETGIAYKKGIDYLRNTFNNRENGDGYWYKDSWEYDRIEKDKYGKPNFTIKKFNDGVGVKQSLHEMSGYYVVKKITHNITTKGFTTTLEIMSYPNIQNDVILTKEMYEKLNKKTNE